MRLVSWNVNGYRAVYEKGFEKWFADVDADVIGLQEVKGHKEAVSPKMLEFKGYQCLWHAAKKPGYSGTAIFTRVEPLSYKEGFGVSTFDDEGRCQIAEFKNFYLLNCYFPNSQSERARLDYKLGFCKEVEKFCKKAKAQGKGVVVQGDLNVAHAEIDLKNPKTNHETPGFYPEERDWMTKFLKSGMRDIFRDRHPEQGGLYTWWSYRSAARPKNVGWRIDYHVISPDLADRVTDVRHQNEVMGSDHCPVVLDLK